jgi:hypothetical protein
MERFLSKLNPKCEHFMQRPQRKSKNFNLVTNPDCWYENYKVGENFVSKMLAQLSEAAEVPRMTNGQIRPTSVCLMVRAGIEDREIVTVTGHRSIDSLKSYNPHLTESRKIAIAQAISNGGKKRHSSDPNPSTSKGSRLEQERQPSQIFQGRNRHNSDPIPSSSRQPSQPQVHLNPDQDNVNPDQDNVNLTQEMVLTQNIVSTSETETENVTPMTALQMMILNEQRIAINHEKAILMTHAAGVNRRTRIIESYQKHVQK